jgi:hypothetical protein
MKRIEQLALVFLLISAPAAAAELKFEKGVRWSSYRDLTSDEFAVRFEEFRNQNLMMIDLDAYATDGGIRYSMVWAENRDGRDWAEHRNLTAEQYGRHWDEYRGRGFRPHDLESWIDGGEQRFAGIWVQNKEGYRWESRRGLTSSEYDTFFAEQREQNIRPIDIEPYTSSSGVLYGAIWVENKEKIEWHQMRDMSREAYQAEVDKRTAEGFTLVDFEAYTLDGNPRFAAIWEKRPGFSGKARTDRTLAEYEELWKQYRDEGLRPIDFESYKTPSGQRYGGVWIEN